MSPEKKLVLLRYTKMRYVPTANYGAEILCENGIPLLAIECFSASSTTKTIETPNSYPTIKIFLPPSNWLPKAVRSSVFFFSLFLKLFFRFRTERPKFILTHGLTEHSLAYLLNIFLKIPYATHVHEVYEKKSVTGFTRLLYVLEGKALRNAQFTIFSELGRQEIYRYRYQLQAPSFLAFNCPRLRVKSKGNDFRLSLGLPKNSLLMGYIGGLENKNLILEGVQAIKRFPNLHFLLAGWASDTFQEELKKKALEYDVSSRIHYLGIVPDRWTFLDGCEIGYCLYKPDEFRTQHLATASNKLMEALASGQSVVTNSNPDFQAFLMKYPVGRAAKELSPAGIEQALSNFEDKDERKAMSEEALSLHKTIFHYERQFQPILEHILQTSRY